MTPIDHVGLTVSDMERAVAFYTAALGALGLDCLTDFTHEGRRHAGFGDKPPTFWISSLRDKPVGPAHVAFVAKSRAEVHAFYTIALSMGGRDNGKPGLRAHYHPDYYSAFVLDADGHNVEAVCHEPE